MPVDTKPEDKPAARPLPPGLSGQRPRHHLQPRHRPRTSAPSPIQGGTPRFTDRDDFKAKVVSIGMSPAVAKDDSRSFNATARQLRELGFSVRVKKEAA